MKNLCTFNRIPLKAHLIFFYLSQKEIFVQERDSVSKADFASRPSLTLSEKDYRQESLEPAEAVSNVVGFSTISAQLQHLPSTAQFLPIYTHSIRPDQTFQINKKILKKFHKHKFQWTQTLVSMAKKEENVKDIYFFFELTKKKKRNTNIKYFFFLRIKKCLVGLNVYQTKKRRGGGRRWRVVLTFD